MDTRNRRSGAAVDDILDEIKGKGGGRPAQRDEARLDNILAELGAGPKKPAAKTAPRTAPEKPAAAAPAAPRAAASTVTAAPAGAKTGKAPASKTAPAQPNRQAAKAPAGTARGTAAAQQPAPAEKPARPAKAATQTLEDLAPAALEKHGDEPLTERPSQRMNRINRGTGSIGHTANIMDIQKTQTVSIPRVGKAAAMDKVESGKFAGDAELLSWFDPDAGLSKRERRRMEKERKRQEAADRKAARKAEKYGEPAPEGEEADFLAMKQAADAAAAQDSAQKGLPDVSGLFEEEAPQRQKAALVPPRREAGKTPPQAAPAKAAKAAGAPGADDGWLVLDSSAGLDEAGIETPAKARQVAPAVPAQTAGGAAQAQPPAQQVNRPAPSPASASPKPAAPRPAPARPAGGNPPAATPAGARPAPGTRPAPQGGQVAAPGGRPPAGAGSASVAGGAAAGAAVASAAVSAAGNTPSAVDAAKTVAFTAVGAGAATGAPKPAPAAKLAGESPKGKVGDTQTFEPEDEAKEEKIPTAAYTQEFETDGRMAATAELEAKEGKSLFLDEMVDDQFRAFFGETIIMDKVDKDDLPPTATGGTGTGKARRRGRKSRTSLFTGEFAQLALDAEAEEELAAAAGDEPEIEEYSRPQDADKVQGDLEALKKSLTTRTVATGVIGVLLLWMGLAYGGTLPMPFLSAAANPIVFSLVYLALVVAAIGINFTTVAAGIAGLVGEPTVDSAPALASLFALLQGVVVFTQLLGEKQPAVTLFGGIAALVLAVNAFGKRLRARVILDNFHLTSGGFDHSAAYIVDGTQHELAHSITSGLEEPDPVLLVSRPTAFVKGFMRQSFSVRQSDYTGRILGWVLAGAGLLAAVVSYLLAKDMTVAVSSAAAVLCIGAPFTSTLLSAVPSAIMQQNNSKVGAVVPGWSAIEDLGSVNVVMAGARDIFPPTSVTLKGIKTYEKERIDLAILYASSVLIEGCDTLRDIFNGVIQGKSDMLYKVESLTREPGRGFTAWVENQRIVIGTREMLQRHAIEPPSIESELQYTTEGCLPVYLAVSGKLFAMFVVRYAPDPEVAETLESLVNSGLSLLVTSNDMNINADLIERAYALPQGVVKVLGEKELRILEPMTGYKAESAGVMSHIGTFTSFIGGMRAAAGCALSEKWSGYVQLASVILAVLLCIGLVVSGGLAGLSMGIILLYQLGWTLFVSIPMLLRF